MLILTGIFVLILSARIWVMVEYSAYGQSLITGFGPFYINVLQLMQSKTKEKQIAPKAKKESGERKYQVNKEYVKKKLIKNAIPTVRQLLDHIKKYLYIDFLTVDLSWGAKDPADCAISYGYVNAGMHGVMALLKANLNIKKMNVRTDLNYDIEKPNIYLKASFSLTVGQLMTMGFSLIRELFRNVKIKKVVYANGKQSSNQ